jgi:hypothetical protein
MAERLLFVSPPKSEMGTNGKYGSKRSIPASRRGTRLRDESRGGTKACSTDVTLRAALLLNRPFSFLLFKRLVLFSRFVYTCGHI